MRLLPRPRRQPRRRPRGVHAVKVPCLLGAGCHLSQDPASPVRPLLAFLLISLLVTARYAHGCARFRPPGFQTARPDPGTPGALQALAGEAEPPPPAQCRKSTHLLRWRLPTAALATLSRHRRRYGSRRRRRQRRRRRRHRHQSPPPLSTPPSSTSPSLPPSPSSSSPPPPPPPCAESTA